MLQDFRDRIPETWVHLPFDDRSDRLRSVCGRFQPRPPADHRRVLGGVSLSDAGGVQLVQVANDLEVIRRDRQDIRLDFSENVFLLLQLEGSCGVEQFGRQSVIAPGDCILVDSSAPSTFYFDSRFSNHLSVHLPRELLLADKAVDIAMSRRLEADDPMSTMLRALVAKLLRTEAGDRRAPHLRQLLLHATRQAFAADPSEESPSPDGRAGGRLELALLLVDRHLTKEYLTPQWLAAQIGVSLRTLQEDFNALGETATSFIRDRRLRLARARLIETRRGAGRATIADVAYSSGFNDISYFNRCFRKMFDCSPKDVARD